jgi:hypothetical protein
MWEKITVALANLGLESAGLDSTTSGQKGESVSLESTDSAQQDEDQLVEYEGMLVSAAAAQRRR